MSTHVTQEYFLRDDTTLRHIAAYKFSATKLLKTQKPASLFCESATAAILSSVDDVKAKAHYRELPPRLLR